LTGEVKLARVASTPSTILQVIHGTLPQKNSDIYQRFERLLKWADSFRRMGVRANADQPDQADIAYAFGARGIGLCRTEHMFFGEGRIPIVQRMSLRRTRPIAAKRSMNCCRSSAPISTACSSRCAAHR
jgi:pyruvate,orthophosphate dikinase